MSVLFYSIFVAFNFFVAISAKNAVPVLLWSREHDLPTVPGLKHYGPVAFNEFLHDALGESQPVIAIFLEEKLSNEDFSLRQSGGLAIFDDLKAAISDDKVSFIPSVENPSKVIRSLGDEGYERIQYTGKVPTELQDPTIIIVSLSDDSEKERAQNLQEHFKAVRQIYGELVKEYPNLLAIYTGKESSYALDESLVRVRREDEPAPDDGHYFLIRDENFVIIATHIEYKTAPTEPAVVVTQVSGATLTMNNDTNSAIMKVSLSGLEVSFVFNASENTRHWGVSHVLHDSGKKLVPSETIWGPRRWSWFCSKEVLFAASRQQKEPDTFVLNITGLQIQPYIDETSGEFGQAMDCLPYFSIAIWTGIFIVLLMLFIMGWGLTMLMDINTNDRFDDPKGKTITIAAAD